MIPITEDVPSIITVLKDYDNIFAADNKGDEVQITRTKVPYSPSLITKLENANVFRVSFSQMIMIAYIISGVLLLLLIVSIVIAIIHKVRRKKSGGTYSPWFIIVPHIILIFILLLISGAIGYFFSALLLFSAFAAAATGLVVFILSIRGTFKNRNRINYITNIALLAVTVIDFFLIRYADILGETALINYDIFLLLTVLGCVVAVKTFYRVASNKNYG